jgi:hypothetical protein
VALAAAIAKNLALAAFAAARVWFAARSKRLS